MGSGAAVRRSPLLGLVEAGVGEQPGTGSSGSAGRPLPSGPPWRGISTRAPTEQERASLGAVGGAGWANSLGSLGVCARVAQAGLQGHGCWCGGRVDDWEVHVKGLAESRVLGSGGRAHHRMTVTPVSGQQRGQHWQAEGRVPRAGLTSAPRLASVDGGRLLLRYVGSGVPAQSRGASDPEGQSSDSGLVLLRPF